MAEKDAQTDSSTVVIWGTHCTGDGLPGPSSSLLVLAVGSVIKKINEGPGVSMYFYLRAVPNQAFEIRSDLDIVHSRLDAFELANLNENFERKGYFQASDAVVGMYHDEVNSELWLVKF